MSSHVNDNVNIFSLNCRNFSSSLSKSLLSTLLDGFDVVLVVKLMLMLLLFVFKSKSVVLRLDVRYVELLLLLRMRVEMLVMLCDDE